MPKEEKVTLLHCGSTFNRIVLLKFHGKTFSFDEASTKFSSIKIIMHWLSWLSIQHVVSFEHRICFYAI